jgi:GT2 family glycosyltransferase
MENNIYNDLEILTVTFKSEHIIDSCLSNIDDNFRVTVVENSNNNEFKKKLEKKKNVKCILAKENIGFGSAFNLGAKEINSKYILHINPDVKINNFIIENLYKEASKIDNLGILSPIEAEVGTIKNSQKSSEDFHKIKETEYVRGFVMMINNDNCKITNYFDENIFLYLEEIDLCRRLYQIKKKVCLIPSISVEHFGGKSHNPIYSEKMEVQRNWHYMWSLFYFSKKHHGIFFAYKKTIKKFFSALIKCCFFYFFKKKKYLIYKHRFLGLLYSYLGKKSSFRVKL